MHALRQKLKNFKAPRSLDRLGNNNHDWTDLRSFQLSFDDELEDHIIEMSNQYYIEKNVVSWVQLIVYCCVLDILFVFVFLDVVSFYNICN